LPVDGRQPVGGVAGVRGLAFGGGFVQAVTYSVKEYRANLDSRGCRVDHLLPPVFGVDAAFLMAKSDLMARPIYQHNREAIEAHFIIVLLVLAIRRNIELKNG
jgi:hypothetical protein